MIELCAGLRWKVYSHHIGGHLELEPGSITTPEAFVALRAGDRLTLDDLTITVVRYSGVDANLVYVKEGKATLHELDARYAFVWEPGERPERKVHYVGHGAPVKNTRRKPRRRLITASFCD